MPQYAGFDSTITGQPAPVTGWYDTDFTTYGTFPAPADLLLITHDQYMARVSGLWAVSGATSLIAYTPPLPLLQASQIALANHLSLGIAVTSDSAPNVSATYALDSISTGQIFQIGVYAATFNNFPGGGTTQYYPDQMGIPHPFPVAVFIAFFQAVASLTAALNQQQGIMAAGGSPTWPSQSVSIL